MIKLNFWHKKYQNPTNIFNDGKPEINKWMISDFVLRRLVPLIGVKPFPLDEQMFLVSVVTWCRPDYVFEWGTHVGKSARLFYEIKKMFDLSYKIYSVDLPPSTYHVEQPGNSRGRYVKNINEVKLLLGDGLYKSLNIVKKISSNKRTLFFLDGDHSFESVCRELDGIVKARPSSTIVVHDTFNQVKDSKYNIGPYLAIKDFCKKHKGYLTFTTNFGLPGMTVLIPKTR